MQSNKMNYTNLDSVGKDPHSPPSDQDVDQSDIVDPDCDHVQVPTFYEDASLLCESDADRYRLLDLALEEVGAGRFSLLMISLTGLGYFVEAAEISIVSLLYPQFMSEWHVKETDLPVISSFMAIGMVAGCVLFGRLADIHGRKAVYKWSIMISVVFGFASSFAMSVHQFAYMRLFLGVGYGGCLVNASPLLLESTPSYARGKSTAKMSFFWCLGTSFVVVLSWLFMDDIGWSWIVRFSSLAGIPVIFGLHFLVPDSPRFFVMKGEYEKAVQSVHVIARINKVPMPSFFTVENLSGALKPGQVVEEIVQDMAGISDLCHKPVLITLLPLMLVWFIKSFGMGIVGFLPLELKHAIGGAQTHYRVAMVTQIGEWIGAFVVAFFAHKLPRILEIRLGLFVLGLTVTGIGLAGAREWLVYSLLIILRIAMAVDFHGLYTYSPEVFPTSIRVLAFSFCQVAQRSAPILSPFLLTHLDVAAGFQVTTMVYGGLLFLASFLTCFLFRETKGAPLVESAPDCIMPLEHHVLAAEIDDTDDMSTASARSRRSDRSSISDIDYTPFGEGVNHDFPLLVEDPPAALPASSDSSAIAHQ